jgi:hypothetical protein
MIASTRLRVLVGALSWSTALSTVVAAVMDPPLPPSLDDLWSGTAGFHLVRTFPVNSPALPAVDAATRVVVVNGSWFLFGRADMGATSACQSGVITTNVRVSTDKGATWGPVGSHQI